MPGRLVCWKLAILLGFVLLCMSGGVYASKSICQSVLRALQEREIKCACGCAAVCHTLTSELLGSPQSTCVGSLCGYLQYCEFVCDVVRQMLGFLHCLDLSCPVVLDDCSLLDRKSTTLVLDHCL